MEKKLVVHYQEIKIQLKVEPTEKRFYTYNLELDYINYVNI